MITIEYEVKEKYQRTGSMKSTKTATNIDEFQELILFLKESLARIARQALKEEQAKGFDKNPNLLVDNRMGRSEDEVKPFGKIEYYSRAVAVDVLMPIYKAILERSPEVSGLYKRHNVVLLNKRLIASTEVELEQFLKKFTPSPTDVVQFVNVLPYAGSLERYGVSKGRQSGRMLKTRDDRKRSGLMIRQPNGAYYLTARAMIRKFKGNANIKFEWINGSNLTGIPKPTSTLSGKPLRYTFATRKGYYTHPTVTVRFYSGGIK
ncbi:hypothetical protein EKK58_10495 [Candidatus Dependentiae bacterium]|nr:MAG: hypothetical protein EKK58_10495 [Candidatus Dependentiae bacterium]